MATHSSVLAWRIPGTGEPGGLLSMGSHSQTQLKRLSSSSSSRISWGKKKDVFQKKTFPPQTGGLLTGLEARKSKIKILTDLVPGFQLATFSLSTHVVEREQMGKLQESHNSTTCGTTAWPTVLLGKGDSQAGHCQINVFKGLNLRIQPDHLPSWNRN